MNEVKRYAQPIMMNPWVLNRQHNEYGLTLMDVDEMLNILNSVSNNQKKVRERTVRIAMMNFHH